MGFPTSHQPRSCIPLTSPKWSSDTQIGHLSQKFQPKTKFCYKVLLSKNFQWQSCSTIKYLSNGVNVLEGDENLGLKALTPNTKDACFTHVALCSRC